MGETKKTFEEIMNPNTVERTFDLTVQELISAGVQHGHLKRETHPTMREFVYKFTPTGSIINLDKTFEALKNACKVIENAILSGKKILFIGTQEVARSAVEEFAKKVNGFYIVNQWVPGLLTNFQTVKLNLNRMHSLQRTLDLYEKNTNRVNQKSIVKKKEFLAYTKELDKLVKRYAGIVGMHKLPELIIAFHWGAYDKEIAKLKEHGSNIELIMLCDTNAAPYCKSDDKHVIIPGNDDSIRSLSVIIDTFRHTITQTIAAMSSNIVKNKVLGGEK